MVTAGTTSRHAYLIQGHLHGKTVVVFAGDCWSVHIQEDKAAVVGDHTPPLLVNLVQMVLAEPAPSPASEFVRVTQFLMW